ncbi:MAG: MDR family MFS transporter, partial [Candidatus Saccharimonadales bacterium]
YLLTTTITIPIAGKLSDLFGRRTLLLVGVAIFALGSLMSGLAADINQLILWRALQGIGGGIITANAFTIVGDLFAARERGKWQGMIGAVFGVSSVAGPLLGGWLTEGQPIFGVMTDWRWTFYINVPVAIAAFALIAIFCPPLRHANKPRIDYKGAAFLTVALATLILAVDNTEVIFRGVMDAYDLSLAAVRTVMALVVVASTAAFIWAESRSPEPILPLRFFRNKNFSLVIGVATLFGAGFMGSILYLTQFNQQVFGASPTESGLMLLPMVAGLMLSSITSGQIISKTGRYKIFMQIGIVLATVMVALMTTLSPESTYAYEAVLMTFLGLGLGLVMPVMNIAVQNEFKQMELGVATSSVQLFRGLGSTVGIALFGAILTSGVASSLTNVQNDPYLQSISQSSAANQIGDFDDSNTLLTLNAPDVKARINEGFEKSTSKLSAAQRSSAQETFETNQQAYASKITHAFSESLNKIFAISAVLMAIAAVLVMAIRERELAHASPESTPGEM